MIQPHSYQKECLKTITSARRHGQDKALVVMASGLGKTVTTAFDFKRFRQYRPGSRLLFLCHQNDILEQAYKEFSKVLGQGLGYGFLNGWNKTNWRKADCLFASFQTMKEWRNRFARGRFDYVVVDESHHTAADTYKPTVDYFRPKFLLGITATPDRADLKDIRLTYGEEVFHLPLEDALARGLLTQVDYRMLTDEIQNLEVLDTPVGKMSIKELNRTLFAPKRDEEIVRIIRRHMRGIREPRAMIFCRSLKHCERMGNYIPDSFSINHKVAHSERREHLKILRQQGGTVLTVDVFNEGIDVPEANVIVFLRSTASPTIFFQQLGRGLRKVPGKDKVLVLDFVGSVDRLETVQKLYQAIRARREEEKQAREGRKSFEVEVGKIRFNEVAKPILDYLSRIRVEYTKAMLIQQLQSLSVKLGKVPTKEDVDEAWRRGESASGNTFINRFGSFTNAKRAAGLRARIYYRKGQITKEEIIEQVREAVKDLKREPRQRDIAAACKRGKCPSVDIIKQAFGSFNEFLTEACFDVKHRYYTTEELIQQYKNLAAKLKRTPTIPDIKKMHKRGECASETTFSVRFRSMHFLRTAADLDPPIRKKRRDKYTSSELLQRLKELGEKLKKVPTSGDVRIASKAKHCASESALRKRFGSFSAALEAAGFGPSRRRAK